MAKKFFDPTSGNFVVQRKQSTTTRAPNSPQALRFSKQQIRQRDARATPAGARVAALQNIRQQFGPDARGIIQGARRGQLAVTPQGIQRGQSTYNAGMLAPGTVDWLGQRSANRQSFGLGLGFTPGQRQRLRGAVASGDLSGVGGLFNRAARQHPNRFGALTEQLGLLNDPTTAMQLRPRLRSMAGLGAGPMQPPYAGPYDPLQGAYAYQPSPYEDIYA